MWLHLSFLNFSPSKFETGVTQVRVMAGSGYAPAWTGNKAFLQVLSSSDTVQLELSGIQFRMNASLSVRLLGVDSNISIHNCVFSGSVGRRALLIESRGWVVLQDTVFFGNLFQGGAAIHG